ncbi:solute carrier family 23 member 3 [Megalops cyprinoides]|uniref:solute carrier family 23 member 3 n=1 Tax=Megalops cyprinoides TaxID=118141 RepID=UPI0018646046|nr:solute carrier family 23 member 3 [Megalops cyprinoides]
MTACEASDVHGEDLERPSGAARTQVFRVDQPPPCLLNLCLALQQVLVQSSLLVLVLAFLQQQLWVQEGEREKLLASGFFYSSISTLLQSWLGTCLPLVQAPSLEFMIPALVLTSQRHQHGSTLACRGQCEEKEESLTQTDLVRELQGMVLITGLVQLVLGMSGLCGLVLRHCGPLVLAPLFCVLGFSIYKDAALLCSDHWGITALAVVLMLLLSQHLRSCFLPAPRGVSRYPVCRMVSVLLSLLSVWAVCAALEHLGHFRPHRVSELLPASRPHEPSSTVPWARSNSSHTLPWARPNSSHTLHWSNPNSSYLAPWISFPLTGVSQLPLLSARGVAAGVAAALGSSISSQSVYLLTARILGAPPPPPAACNRGLCAEGLGSMSAALLGGMVGVSSSVPNACTLGLSQCGSRCTVQLAAMLGLVLGMSPRLTQLITSVPLGIHGAVLSVTYAVAIGTGVAYFQYTHMDSGRNIFNIGFAVFMSLLIPRWFSLQPAFIATGISSLDVLLQSLLTLPVFLVGLLAFLLDNTVSGSPSERGLPSSVMRKGGRASSAAEYSQQLATVYDPPFAVRRLLHLPGLRVVPFCACRTPVEEAALSPMETADLLSENQGNGP